MVESLACPYGGQPRGHYAEVADPSGMRGRTGVPVAGPPASRYDTCGNTAMAMGIHS